MNHLPEDLQYAATHVWVRCESENVVRVGITDFAQQQLGDLVYVTLPEVGQKLHAEEKCAVVESVKTASDIFSPVSGTVVAVNNRVVDEPELVNDEPYKTWLFCIQADDLTALSALMTAEAYQAYINE
jgi:glycine cleavage system H protein